MVLFCFYLILGLPDSYPSSRLNKGKTLINVQCYTLEEIMLATGIRKVDYMTVDTEGSEYEALVNFPFHKYVIDYVQIEILVLEVFKKKKIYKLMKENGYRLVINYIVSEDTIDAIFERTEQIDTLEFSNIHQNGWPMEY
jgi:hypothetical protein